MSENINSIDGLKKIVMGLLSDRDLIMMVRELLDELEMRCKGKEEK
jgi:hypothetical protein